MRIIFIITLVFLSSELFSQNFSDCFITPEMFGCKSGKVADPSANADSLQLAVNSAIKTGRKLVSNSSKHYYIGKSLLINGPINIDFGLGKIVATDNIDIIQVEYNTQIKFFGVVSNIVLDLNGRARPGIHCINSVKIHFSDSEITNIPPESYGLLIDKGYEIVCDNLHFKGSSDFATGIKITTSDCHFSDCIMINCKTAIDNRGSNCYERIHAWIGNKGQYIDGSTFYLSRGGNSFLSQCCSDTFDKAFDITGNSILMISQQKNFHNLIMWNRNVDSIHPIVFNFLNNNIANSSKIYLSNSNIGGLTIDNKNRQIFSNIENPPIEISSSMIIY